MHLVGTADGVFLTRSIRRNPVAFNLNKFADLENYPWEFGLAALGNKLVHNKRLTHPLAFGVGAAFPPLVDFEAVQVQNYAAAHPDEDVEDEAEAGHAPLAGDDEMLDDTEYGEHAPKTPKLAEDELKRNIAAVTSTDLDLYEHEDEDLKVCFGEDELDSLEPYDMEFEQERLDVGELDDDEVTEQLTFPYDKHESHKYLQMRSPGLTRCLILWRSRD
eukprot:s3208_g7.t1